MASPFPPFNASDAAIGVQRLTFTRTQIARLVSSYWGNGKSISRAFSAAMSGDILYYRNHGWTPEFVVEKLELIQNLDREYRPPDAYNLNEIVAASLFRVAPEGRMFEMIDTTVHRTPTPMQRALHPDQFQWLENHQPPATSSAPVLNQPVPPYRGAAQAQGRSMASELSDIRNQFYMEPKEALLKKAAAPKPTPKADKTWVEEWTGGQKP
jgi:hypothetical protein